MSERWEHHKQTVLLIRQKLESALSPSYLEVLDESHQHIGHTAAELEPKKGHFKVIISSIRMQNLNKIAQHQLVYKALAGLMPRIHALSISVVG